MKPEEKKNIGQSILDKLRNKAKENGEDAILVHQRYAMERFLYRLSISPHQNQFILKGGMLLLVWLDGRSYRVTRDLDLLGHGSSDTAFIESIIVTAQAKNFWGVAPR